MSEQPPQQPYPPTPPPYGAPVAAKTDAAGFFRALFDFSFSEFITPKVVKFVYIIAVAGVVLAWLGITVAMFSQSAGMGLVFLVLGPIGVILYLALIRMTLEFYVAVTRMSQDINRRLPQM